MLDKKIEMNGMTCLDKEERRVWELKLKYTNREERVKWFQRCKDQEILEGDNNSRYYHAKANGRRRKGQIHKLIQEEGVIEGQHQLMSFITNFYKTLFGSGGQSASISMNMEDFSKLREEDRNELIKVISKEEVKAVVVDMKKNRAPGPDGFPIEFYEHFWDLISPDLMRVIEDFQRGNIDIERLNYGVITLVPKTKDAVQIQKFRPICLLNVSFKIITKILMLRLSKVIEYLISQNQTAFIKNRNIM